MATSSHHPRRTFLAGVLLAVGLLLVTAGCVSVNRLRAAQEAFSRAAAAENRSRLAPAAALDESPLPEAVAQAVAGTAEAQLGYRESADLLLALQGDSRQWERLESANLAGHALSLLALAHWRLGEYPEAREAARRAAEAAGGLLPRDQILMSALPALIVSDQAYARIQSDTMPCEREVSPGRRIRTFCFRGTHEPALDSFLRVSNWIAGPDGALAGVASARRQAETNHPVQPYLLQAQLAAYANLVVAFDRYGSPGSGLDLGTASQRATEATAEAKVALEELLRRTRGVDREAADRLREYWTGVTGLP